MPARIVDTTATMRLFQVDDNNASWVNSFAYHWSENPCQRAENFDALNENTMRIAIGRYRNSRSVMLAATIQ